MLSFSQDKPCEVVWNREHSLDAGGLDGQEGAQEGSEGSDARPALVSLKASNGDERNLQVEGGLGDHGGAHHPLGGSGLRLLGLEKVQQLRSAMCKASLSGSRNQACIGCV